MVGELTVTTLRLPRFCGEKGKIGVSLALRPDGRGFMPGSIDKQYHTSFILCVQNNGKIT